jgi:hypothetical protein
MCAIAGLVALVAKCTSHNLAAGRRGFQFENSPFELETNINARCTAELVLLP